MAATHVSTEHARTNGPSETRNHGAGSRGNDKQEGTYAIELIVERDLELLHGVEDDAEGSEDVVEYDGAPLLLFALGEALGVDEAHLLQHGGLAALAGTWGSHAFVSHGKLWDGGGGREWGIGDWKSGLAIGNWELGMLT